MSPRRRISTLHQGGSSDRRRRGATGRCVYSILWFFLFFIEVWLAISVFIDIFRSHDLKGWAKAAWIILVILFPLVGILAYFIFRGDKMRAHQIQATQNQEEYVRSSHPAARPEPGLRVADEISKLVDLKNSGVDHRGGVRADEGARDQPDGRREFSCWRVRLTPERLSRSRSRTRSA